MIRYRDGVVFFPDTKTFVATEKSFDAAALACQVDDDAAVPALRETIRLDVVVEGWRCGPLRADVVHVAGSQLGLHLSDDAVGQLKQLLTQLSTRQRRLTEVFRETATAIPSPPPESPNPQPSARDSDPLEATDFDQPPPTGTLPTVEADSAAPLFGHAGGPLSLGTLAELFRFEPVERLEASTSMLRLFRHLAQRLASGALTLRSPTFTKTVWFKRGTILAVQVSPMKEDEMLGQILIKARWVSPQDLGNALRWARDQQVGLGKALVQSGRITSDQLNKALAHQNYRRLRDVFTWSSAGFEFNEEETPPPPPYYAMAVERLNCELALELLREARAEQLTLLLKAFEDCYPALDPSAGAETLRKLLPSDKTRHVCQQIFDGKRTVRQTIAASQLGRPSTVRLLLYLRAAGVLAMHPDPVTPPTQALVDERLRTLQVQDFFQRLNLSYLVHPADIEPALQRRASAFAHGSAYRRVNAQACDRIDILLREAAKALGHGPTRQKYRAKLVGADGIKILNQLVNDALELARVQDESDRVRQLGQIFDDLVNMK